MKTVHEKINWFVYIFAGFFIGSILNIMDNPELLVLSKGMNNDLF
jgi:hypothetical protein